MKFQFIKTDANLAKPVSAGGCGLSIAQVNGIVTQQKDLSYEFCYHTGYHGEGQSHYVYMREEGSNQVKGCTRVFINGSKAGQASNDGQMKNKQVNDAKAVVAANQALFLQIAQSQ